MLEVAPEIPTFEVSHIAKIVRMETMAHGNPMCGISIPHFNVLFHLLSLQSILDPTISKKSNRS